MLNRDLERMVHEDGLNELVLFCLYRTEGKHNNNVKIWKEKG